MGTLLCKNLNLQTQESENVSFSCVFGFTRTPSNSPVISDEFVNVRTVFPACNNRRAMYRPEQPNAPVTA